MGDSPCFLSSFSSDEGKKRREDRRRIKDTLLLSRCLADCVTLVPVNDMLQHLSYCDKVLLLRVISRILASIWSGDLVFSSLDLRQASFDLEAWSLFPDVVYGEEGEEAHRLGVPMRHSSSRSLELSLRRYDTIAFLHSFLALVWSEVIASLSEGFLSVHLILLANVRRLVEPVLLPYSHREWKGECV